MESIIFLVFVVLFVLFLVRLLSAADSKPRSVRRQKRGAKSSQAATQAMQRAGYQATPEYVQVSDIGLLAYRHSDEPKLVRYGDVLTDTRFLRPFADLWLPYAATGAVRFELLDSEGRLRYADEAEYDLESGQNTLLPGTWLPLAGKTIRPGQWVLRVLAGGTLVGVHVFDWQPVGGGDIQRYSDGDGELSPELAQALQVRPKEAVSLSDLLAEQDE